jgi:hypothetical protein
MKGHMGQGYLQCADIISLDLPGVRAFTGGFILGGALGYVAVWEPDDGGEGESMKSVEEEYRLSTAAKAAMPRGWWRYVEVLYRSI